MQIGYKIIKSVLALLLFVVLAIPTGIQFSHALENHKHTVCVDNDTHFHAVDVDCSLCDYQLISYDYSVTKYPEFHEIIIPKRENSKLTLPLVNLPDNNPKQLRAPPVL